MPFLNYLDQSSITVFFLYFIDSKWGIGNWRPTDKSGPQRLPMLPSNPKCFLIWPLSYLMHLSDSLPCTSQDKQMEESGWNAQRGGVLQKNLWCCCGEGRDEPLLVLWIQKIELMLLPLPRLSAPNMAQLIKCQGEHEALWPGTISLLGSVQPLQHHWQWTNVY